MTLDRITLISVVTLFLLAFVVSMTDGRNTGSADIVKSQDDNVAAVDVGNSADSDLQRLFRKAAEELDARQYDAALKTLHRVLELAPDMPEARVNMGYTLLGMGNYEIARDYFKSAIDLNSYQANAYWGLAVAYENLEDLPAAMGAMRTYIHLAKAGDPYVRRARSALWEWETTLARGPLPEEEQEWLDRNQREWVERNSATVDSVDDGEVEIMVSPIK